METIETPCNALPRLNEVDVNMRDAQGSVDAPGGQNACSDLGRKPMQDSSDAERRKADNVVVPKLPASSYLLYYKQKCEENKQKEGCAREVINVEAKRKFGKEWKQLSVLEQGVYKKIRTEKLSLYKLNKEKAVPTPTKKESLCTRCSPRNLCNLLRSLKGTPEKELAIKSLGLGCLLQVPEHNLKRGICQWMASRYDLTSNTIKINDRSLTLTVEDVAVILGLPNSGVDVVCSANSKELEDVTSRFSLKELLNKNHKYLRNELKEMTEVGEQWKARFLVWAMGEFLCPLTTQNVDRSYISCLTDDALRGQVNWAKHVRKKLYEGLFKFKNESPVYMTGCIYVLEVMFYDHVCFGFERAAICGRVSPRFIEWGQKEIDQMRKLIGTNLNDVEGKIKPRKEWHDVANVPHRTGDVGIGNKELLDRISRIENDVKFCKSELLKLRAGQMKMEENIIAGVRDLLKSFMG